jgi:hypothetical protein
MAHEQDAIMSAEPGGDEARLALSAGSGDPEAEFAYAMLLLRDPARSADGPRAIKMFESAAGKAHGGAVAMTALFEAMGSLRPQNWPKALDRLRDAAELDCRAAQGQLLALAGLTQDCGETDWADVRNRIAADELLKPPPRQMLSEAPRIIAYPGFASAVECAWIIDRARDRLQPARIFDPASAGDTYDSARDNDSVEFLLPDMDVVLEAVRARIASATRLPVPIFEPTQVLHYSVGEQFRPHHDFFDLESGGIAEHVRRFGQRIGTMLVYLNDSYEGGETAFPRIGLGHRGKTGDALFFANIDRSGRGDPMTLHAGAPPTSGEKWVFSQWIRDRLPSGVGQ